MTVQEMIDGDGRRTHTPPNVLASRRHPSKKVSTFSVQNAVRAFLKDGVIWHTTARTTMAFVIQYCEENCIPFALESHVADGRCIGYSIRRTEAKTLPEIIGR